MLDLILSIMLALFFLSLSFALGRKILSLFSFPLSFHEHILFSTVFGVSFFGLIFFFIGVFQLYYLWFFILLFLLLSFLFCKDILSFFSGMYSLIKTLFPYRYTSFFIRLSFLILSLFVLANFFFSLTPEIQWDSLVYHLTQAKLYASHHGIVELPYDYHTYMPKQFDILYVLGEVFALHQTAKIFTFFFNLFLMLGIFFFVRRYWNYDVALLTSTLFYTIPTLALYQSTTYNDIPATLFLFYSCYSFVLLLQTLNKKFLLLTGVFLGAAAATKILLLSLLPFFILALFFFSLQQKISLQNKKYSSFSLILSKACFFLDALQLFLLVFLFLSPWMILTDTQVDNPVYPFFYSVLDGGHWSASLEEYWSTLRADYGSGRSVSSFFLSPWYITMEPMRYGPVYGITPLFFMFLPLFFFFMLFSRSSFFSSPLQKKICFFFLFFSLFFFVVWFFLASDIRYLFPILPALTLLSVLPFFHLLQSSSLGRRVIPSFLLLLLFTNLFFFFVAHRNTVQVLFSIQDKESYIHSYVQNYPMAQWINAHLSDDVLLFIANDDRVYFYDKPYIQGYPIIQGVIDYPSLQSAFSLYSLLLEKGVTHVVLVKHHATDDYTSFEGYYNEQITNLWLALVTEYGTLITVQDDVALYTLN